MSQYHLDGQDSKEATELLDLNLREKRKREPRGCGRVYGLILLYSHDHEGHDALMLRVLVLWPV
jgi:hypothetical protein